MKQIYLNRHAHAGGGDGTPDHDRALSERGVDEARMLAKWIGDSHIRPDVVLCSTANRCQQTYGLVQEICGLGKPHYVDALYLASAGDLLSQIHMLDETFASVLLVGHNPGLADFSRSFDRAQHVRQADKDALVRFAPATFVSASCNAKSWKEASPHNITLTQCLGISL